MPNNYKVKDADGNTISIFANEVSSGIYSNKITPIIGGVEASDQNPIPVKGGFFVVSGEFQRPSTDATAYSAGDLIGNSTSASTPLEISGCARVNGGAGYIVGALLATNLKSITTFVRVHIYNEPPVQSNDNLPHLELYTDIGKKVNELTLGPLSTPADSTNSTLSKALDSNLRIGFKCKENSNSLFFNFETIGNFTPSSGQSFALILQIDPN